MNLKCKILLAQPIVQDPMFANSIVFVFNHNQNGSDGVILNGPQAGLIGIAEMQTIVQNNPQNFQQLANMMMNGKFQPVPLFRGGPCGTPGIFFVHGYKEFAEAVEPDHINGYIVFNKQRMTVMDGLYFGTPFTFATIIESNKLTENKFRFFHGQACWGPGQLEQEIKVGGWKVIDASADLFFHPDKINNRELSPFMRLFEPSLN